MIISVKTMNTIELQLSTIKYATSLQMNTIKRVNCVSNQVIHLNMDLSHIPSLLTSVHSINLHILADAFMSH